MVDFLLVIVSLNPTAAVVFFYILVIIRAVLITIAMLFMMFIIYKVMIGFLKLMGALSNFLLNQSECVMYILKIVSKIIQ